MSCWHLTFPARDRLTLFPDEDRRRLAIHKLADVAGNETVLFCLVDDHGHVVVACSLARAKVIRRSLRRAWQGVAVVPLDTADLRPVANRGHLLYLVRYHLQQVVHHEIEGADPALWSGSCFQELIGARVVQDLSLPLWTVLPRYRLRAAYEDVGLPPRAIEPLGDHETRAAGATRIVEAAAAALALPADFRGKAATVMAAKRAAVQTALQANLPTSEIAWALGVSPRTARRLKEKPADQRVIRALRIRLALENARADQGIARAQPLRSVVRPTRSKPSPPSSTAFGGLSNEGSAG